MNIKNEVLKSGIFDFKIFPLDDDILNRCTGKNGKKLFVPINGPENTDTLDFLAKVMAAVGYDLYEDALTVFLTPKQPFSLTRLAKKTGVHQAVFFGILPVQAGLNIETLKYEVLDLNGITFIFADELSKIQQDVSLKRQLWLAMKNMFLPKEK